MVHTDALELEMDVERLSKNLAEAEEHTNAESDAVDKVLEAVARLRESEKDVDSQIATTKANYEIQKSAKKKKTY